MAAAAVAAGARVVHVVATLTDDTPCRPCAPTWCWPPWPSTASSSPPRPHHDDVEGFDGREVEAWLATDHEDEAVVATVAGRRRRRRRRDRARRAADEPAEAAPAPEAAAPAVAEPAEPGAARPPRPPSPTAAAAPKKAAATVRVDAERLDALMHLMGELVVHRTRVESLAAEADVPGLTQAMQELTRSSQALQAMVMQVRMVPVEAVFMRFPRLVRDLSAKLAKHVELELVGEDTELDRTVVEALGDPLVHLVRNALDHGLEPPEERVAAGKPRDRHARDLGPPRRRQRRHRGPRRRPRHRPGEGRHSSPSSAA